MRDTRRAESPSRWSSLVYGVTRTRPRRDRGAPALDGGATPPVWLACPCDPGPTRSTGQPSRRGRRLRLLVFARKAVFQQQQQQHHWRSRPAARKVTRSDHPAAAPGSLVDQMTDQVTVYVNVIPYGYEPRSLPVVHLFP